MDRRTEGKGGGWEDREREREVGGGRILMSGKEREKREGERMNDRGKAVNCSRARVCVFETGRERTNRWV